MLPLPAPAVILPEVIAPMKPFAIFLVILLLAAIAGVGYLYFTSNLTVSFSSCVAVDPLTQMDYFTQLKSSLENETFVGTRFDSAPLSSADQYLFYTWTLHLENNSALPADVIEIQVTPMTGDVLQLGDTAEHSLPAHSSSNLSATVLTARDKHSVREAIVTWYTWGLPFSARLTLGK